MCTVSILRFFRYGEMILIEMILIGMRRRREEESHGVIHSHNVVTHFRQLLQETFPSNIRVFKHTLRTTPTTMRSALIFPFQT